MKTELYIRQDIGKGDPIVLLHGIFADGTQWETISKLLQKEYRVIVVDVLGHGKSPRDQHLQYTPKEHAAALYNALKRVHATENVTVVGYSMGGAVALSYAAMYPRNIQQLYLISTPFYLNPDQMIINKYASSVMVTKASQKFYDIIQSLLGTNRIVQKMVRYGDASRTFHKMIGANDNQLDSIIIQKSIKHMINEFDFAGHLSKVTAPVTYYAGTKDPFVVQSQVHALRTFNKYMDIQRLDVIKIDHMLVQNLPKEIVGLITKNRVTQLHIHDDVGTGNVLIMLHGIESSSSYWANLVNELSKHHRVITIDLLGFGKSPQPKNIAYNIDQHITALHDTIQILGIQKYSIVSHSLGAVLSMAYAEKYKNEIDSLTLLSPVLLLEQNTSKKISVKSLQKLRAVPSVTELYSMLTDALGDKRMARFLPSIRSLENVIHKQKPLQWAQSIKDIPTTMLYGKNDPLIDKDFLQHVASKMNNITITPLLSQYHNFSLYNPEFVLQTVGKSPFTSDLHKKKSIKIPKNFFKQIVALAIPILLIKSFIFTAVGLLLFTDYAGETLTIAVSLYVIVQSYKTIKGAFSLKNEGLSYIGYALLGGFIGLVAYGLLQHPELSIKIAAYILCITFILAGFMRIIVAQKWTNSKKLKHSLLITGIPMTVLGLAALLGSITSVYIIIYTVAAYLIAKGVLYAWYAFAAFIMAYIRGFNTY